MYTHAKRSHNYACYRSSGLAISDCYGSTQNNAVRMSVFNVLRLDIIGKKREEVEMWGWNVDFLASVAAFI